MRHIGKDTKTYQPGSKESGNENDGFFPRVYAIVAQIPEGKVTTYGRIAAMLGRPRAAKVVGWAMRSTPSSLGIPCHRVVNKSGTLAPGFAFGGPEVQRHMLEAEGITFTDDGYVDMEKHIWNG